MEQVPGVSGWDITAGTATLHSTGSRIRHLRPAWKSIVAVEDPVGFVLCGSQWTDALPSLFLCAGLGAGVRTVRA